jgi:ectoine hydroxylase-related dioxygenase (phytanoyl-CoA dioxygenase family)
MYPAFLDSTLQKDFERKGYVLFPSLLDAKKVETLLSLFQKYQNEFSGPFHTSHFSTDISYKKQVHDTIAAEVFPIIAPNLNGFVPLFGNFMIKNPDKHVAMDLHADWTYVDEGKFRSAAIWVPLIDTNEENGCLGVIEGSHQVTNGIRGPLIRQSSRQHEGEWEKRYGKLLPMRAGDAIVYDHALLHYSPANKTIQPRPAINLSMAPSAAAPWIHYCQPEGTDEIDVYSVSDIDFYIRYTHFQRPEIGHSVRKQSPSEVKYIDDRMNQFWKKRLLNKVAQWF